MYKGFLTAALSVSVTVTASTLSPQDMIKLHVQRAQNMTGTAHKSSSGVTAGKRGSLVYLDNGENCDKDITSGFGFTLGECVVRQNEGHGVKYANCFYDTGNVVFTFTECSDKLCQEDCVDYMMINSKQCVYGPEPYNGQIVCSPNVDAYNNYEDLTLSSRQYFGDDVNCSGPYGYWSSQAMQCTDVYDRACSRANSNYYSETTCDVVEKN